MNCEHFNRRYCIANSPPDLAPKPNVPKPQPRKSISDNLKAVADTAAAHIDTLRTALFKPPQRLIYRPKRKTKRNTARVLKNCCLRTVGAAAGVLGVFSVFCVLLSAFCVPCYRFTSGGALIGYSTDKNIYSKAVASINSQLADCFGSDGFITANADTAAFCVPKNYISSETDFYKSAAESSPLMVCADVLVADGRELAYFESKTELDKALDDFVKLFSEGSVSAQLLNDISYTEKYVPTAKLTAPENVVSVLKDTLTVCTVFETTYTEPIAHETQTVPDDTMYEGSSAVVTVGADGIQTVHATLTAHNGEEISKTVTSSTTDTEPVTEVVKIGTKHIPTGVGSGSFIFPTTGTISSRFGPRWNRQHKGLDIANSTGTDIMAADEGIVIYSGQMTGYGNIIIIDHKNGCKTYYGHCSELFAPKGKIVEKGEIIAAMGSTGNSTGPHLHFEVRVNDVAENPEKYVSAAG